MWKEQTGGQGPMWDIVWLGFRPGYINYYNLLLISCGLQEAANEASSGWVSDTDMGELLLCLHHLPQVPSVCLRVCLRTCLLINQEPKET